MSSGTWSRAIKGWLAGCGAGTAVIVSFVWILVAFGTVRRGIPVGLVDAILGFLLPAGFVFLITCVLTGLPAAAIVWLSERFALRSIWFFGCTGAVTGVLGQTVLFTFLGKILWPLSISPLFAGAGFVAGLVYWRLAGRHAGHASREGA